MVVNARRLQLQPWSSWLSKKDSAKTSRIAYRSWAKHIERRSTTHKRFKLACVTIWLLLACGCQSLSTPEPLPPRVVMVGCEEPPTPEAWFMEPFVRMLKRIIGITDEGDQGLIALRACQGYVRELAQWKE